MSRRLIMLLALAFVVGIACAAYAEVQNVKVSGDITAYGISRNLSLKDTKGGYGANTFGDHVENALATITRVRVDADLTDNVMTTVRLINERYWGGETENMGTNAEANTQIDLSLAMVTLKEFLYSPLSLTIGRQELHFGNDMIVGDPDTNNAAPNSSVFGPAGRDADLDARKSFDAIRAVLNYDPLVIDAVVAKVAEGNLNRNDDTDLYGINVNYKVGEIDLGCAKLMNTVAEGYWWQRRLGRDNTRLSTSVTRGAKKEDITNVIGGRIATSPIENMTYQIEAAYQYGKRVPTTVSAPQEHTVQRKAWALETAATYDWKKVKWTPSTTLMYAYFSGDHEQDPTSKNNLGAWRGWDPMFENQSFGNIANALFNQTNIHLVGAVISAKAKDDLTLKGEYYAYWAAKAYREGGAAQATIRDTGTAINLNGGKRFVGQEVDLTATYDYTEDVQLALMGGWFIPEKYFTNDNDNLASEVIGSMKVTF